MKLLGELKANNYDLTLNKIVLTVNGTKESIVLDMLEEDWYFDVDKEYGDSCFSFYFYGINPNLINIAGSRSAKISYIKLFGTAHNLLNGEALNVVWNISCDMSIDDIQVNKNALEDVVVTWVNLIGEMW